MPWCSNPQSLAPKPFPSVLTTPQRRWLVNPHIDYQLNDNNTLSLRYLFTHADIRDAGIGGFDLISRGYHLQFNLQHRADRGDGGARRNRERDTLSVLTGTSNQTDCQHHRARRFRCWDRSTAAARPPTHGSDRRTASNCRTIRRSCTERIPGDSACGCAARQTTVSSPLNFNGTFTFSGGLAPAIGCQQSAGSESAGASRS